MPNHHRRLRPPRQPRPEPISIVGSPSRLVVQAIGSRDNVADRQSLDWLSDVWMRQDPMLYAYITSALFRSTAIRNGAYSLKHGNPGDGYLYAHLDFCRRHGIEVLVNCVSAGRAQCDDRASLLTDELDMFDRFDALGFWPDGVQMQSIVSGRVQTPQCLEMYDKFGASDPASWERRKQDVYRFCEAMLSRYPHLRLIVADTAFAKTGADHDPRWNYRRDYLDLANGMAQRGFPAPAFHLACAGEEVTDSELAGLRQWSIETGLSIGLKPINDSANQSADVFERDFLAFGERIAAVGLPREITGTSWNRAYPTDMGPPDVPGTMLHAIRGWVDLGIIAPRMAA